MMPRPRFGEANLSALIGAALGSVGGLFSLGLVPAIVTRRPEYLVAAPTLSVFSFFVSGAVAWVLGGQLGPRLARLLGERAGLIAGGILGGLLPLAGLAALGWHLATS
jgi:hypothetical protein